MSEDATSDIRIDIERIRPSSGRHLVEKLNPSDRSRGGIILPPSAQEGDALILARVLRCGDPRISDHGASIPLSVDEDDIVLIGKHAGTIVDRDTRYKIINDVEIFAVLEQED